MESRIGPITGVTIMTPDLAASEAAYGRDLGYEVVGRTRVSAAHASLWGTPDMVGAPMLLMSPAAGRDFVFRFIEWPAAAGYRAFTGHGWNAVELIVADVDALSGRFERPGFDIVAPPMDLSFCSDIRAMQIRGPGGEILYHTVQAPGPGPTRRRHAAPSTAPSSSSWAANRCRPCRTTTPPPSVCPPLPRSSHACRRWHSPSDFPRTPLPDRCTPPGRCYVEADEMPRKRAGCPPHTPPCRRASPW